MIESYADIEDNKSTLTEVADWIMLQADWRSMITLTYRDIYRSPEVGDKDVRRLIMDLNKDIYGPRYTRLVHHSYFSYLLATEYQSRGTLHFHMLVDRPVNFELIHKIWNYRHGFAQTSILKDKYSSIIYSLKYCLKRDDWRIYIQSKQFPVDKNKYDWWK